MISENIGKDVSINDDLHNLQKENYDNFYKVCNLVHSELNRKFNDERTEVQTKTIEIQKNAIMGHEEEVNIYKEKIKSILEEKDLESTEFPDWYLNLEDGIFAEIYGFAGLTPWIYSQTTNYAKSSSAKLIGGRLYCLINGRSELQPQRFTQQRFNQLKRSLLMASPSERLEKGFHELYLNNGIRVTIFSGSRTKNGQDVIVFRKYILDVLTFENLSELGTIPMESTEFFKTMIKIGFNIIIAGQVRSGKTTFLQVWQSYEDSHLEGLAVATDPETPWHIIMKDAPIMQLIADEKELEDMVKALLRGDNDYVLIEEMRDAVAFNFALDITSIGTTRTKATIHDNNAINIPHKMASKIKSKYGGDYNNIVSQIFKNFNYVFEFCQLTDDKSKKILKGIYEYSYDYKSDRVKVIPICIYNEVGRFWSWNCHIENDKESYFTANKNLKEEFMGKLKELEEKHPLAVKNEILPKYYLGNRY